MEYSLDSFKYSDNPNQKITYEYQDSINENDKNGKYFYEILIKNLKTREITQTILNYEDFSNFIAELKKLLK